MKFDFRNSWRYGLSLGLILILAAGAAACSNTAAPTASPAVSTSKPAPPASPSLSATAPNNLQRQGAVGSVVSVNGDTLTLSTIQGAQVTVIVNDGTVIEKTVSGSPSDLQPGQVLTIVGPPDASGNIPATAIMIRPQGFAAPAAGTPVPSGTLPNRQGNAGGQGFGGGQGFTGGQGFPGGAGRGAVGTLNSINGNLLTVTTLQGNQISVSLTSSTSLEKTVQGSLSDLKPGDLLTVAGPADASGKITATTISIQSAGAISPGGPGRLNPASPPPSAAPANSPPASSQPASPTVSITKPAASTTASTSTTTPASSPLPAVSPPAPVTSPPATTSSSVLSTLPGMPPLASILSPLYNSTVAPGNVTVTLVISNFNLVNKIGQRAAPGEGHVIYYLDATPPTVAGQTAVTSAGTYAEIAGTSYTWNNIPAGPHRISIQLVNNDGTPLESPVTGSEPLQVVAVASAPALSSSSK